MAEAQVTTAPRDLFEAAGATSPALPIWLVAGGRPLDQIAGLSREQQAWLAAQDFKGQAKRHVLLPGADGRPAGAVLGIGEGDTGEPCGPAELLAGLLPTLLPAGTWTFAHDLVRPELAAVACTDRYEDGTHARGASRRRPT